MTQLAWYTNDDVADAIPAARASSKPILVDFWDPTCLGCAKLFVVTYADEAVRDLLSREFICVKYNIKRPDEWFRKLGGSVAHLWTPDVIVLSDRLTQLRRSSGYLAPTRFAAQLRLGLGLWNLHRTKADRALDHFSAIASMPDPGDAAPEALYWAGVASYRTDGLAGLTEWWETLADQFPNSDWANRADCLDVQLRPGGFLADDPSSVTIVPSGRPLREQRARA